MSNVHLIVEASLWNMSIIIIIPVLLVAAMFFMPESPYYLLLKDKDIQAVKSLAWLRGKNYDSSEEIKDMKDKISEERKIGSISFKTMLTEEVYWKPLSIVMTLMFLQQFCGINAVLFYTQDIFRDAGNEDIDAGKRDSALKFFS